MRPIARTCLSSFQVALAVLALTWLVMQGPTVSIGDSPPQKTTQPDESLDVRAARADLELAQLELQKVVEKNRQVPHSYPQILVERLEDSVHLAENQLKQRIDPTAAHGHAVHIAEAKLAVERARRHLERGIELNRRLARLADATELARRRAALQVAVLRLERAKQLDPRQSSHAHTEWQLEQLRDDLLDLRLELAKLKHE